MDYTKDITNHKKGKQGDRRELQGILSDRSKQYSLRQMAKHFDCAPNTIRNELKRGAHSHTCRYEAARAQRTYIASHSNSVCRSKRFLTSNFVTWTVRKVLQKHWSLDACHGYALDNHLFPLKEIVFVKTLYNYVDSMLLRLRNIDLPLKVRRRRTARGIKKNQKFMGRSIDERDSNADGRNEFGHWEIDTVIVSKSKSDNVVLTLVERITRKYIELKITSKTSFAVKEGIAYLKEYYGTKFSLVFKTIH